MKKYLIFILIIFSINIYSQKQDSIIYIFPDNVEKRLFEQLIDVGINDIFNFQFYLNTLEKDTFMIALSYSGGKSNNYWVNNTNRFVLVKDKKYPLVLDYDSNYSTENSKEVGYYGQREGNVLRSFFIYDGYNITFDKSGKILKEDYGI